MVIKGILATNDRSSTIIMPNNVYKIDPCLYKNCKTIKSVHLTDVVLVGEEAFKDSGVEEIEFSFSCRNISNSAFENTKLMKVDTPLGLKYIGQDAFKNCSLLEYADIRNAPQYLPSGMFAGCQSLKVVLLGGTIVSIGNRAFENCEQLPNIDIPKTVCFMGEYVFAGAGLQNITLGANVRSIGKGIFAGCNSLQNVFMSKSKITTIQKSAFHNCSALKYIELPSSLSEIKANRFSGCVALSEIDLPKSLRVIGAGAFANTSIKILKIPPKVTYIDNTAFNTDITLIVQKKTYSEEYAKNNHIPFLYYN